MKISFWNLCQKNFRNAFHHGRMCGDVEKHIDEAPVYPPFQLPLSSSVMSIFVWLLFWTILFYAFFVFVHFLPGSPFFNEKFYLKCCCFLFHLGDLFTVHFVSLSFICAVWISFLEYLWLL